MADIEKVDYTQETNSTGYPLSQSDVLRYKTEQVSLKFYSVSFSYFSCSAR